MRRVIDARQWSHLSGLMLTARRLVDGLYAGGHASRRFGSGLEFHDYRPYVPGDDPAAVDWKLFGRTDRYYLKRYQRYTDLHLYLFVDASASMHFAGLDRRGRPLENKVSGGKTVSDTVLTKFAYAQRLAAALAFLAVRQGDRVGLGVFAGDLRHHLPIAGSWPHLMRLVRTLERARPAGAADVGKAIAAAHAQLPRRGLVVLLSDLLDEPAGLFDGLNRLRHAHFDVTALQILTPQERDLAALGSPRMQLVDPETRHVVATDVRAVQRRYAQLLGEHLDAVRRGCLARRVEHVPVSTDRPMLDVLRGYLTRRGG